MDPKLVARLRRFTLLRDHLDGVLAEDDPKRINHHVQKLLRSTHLTTQRLARFIVNHHMWGSPSNVAQTVDFIDLWQQEVG